MTAVLCGMLVVIQVRDALVQMRTTDNELAGLEPTGALSDVVCLSQQHRGLSATFLGGKPESETERASRQADTDKAVQRFDVVEQSDIDNERIRDDCQRLSGDWRALASAVSARQIPGAESLARRRRCWRSRPEFA